MNNRKRQKLKRLYITIAALVLILAAAVALAQGWPNDITSENEQDAPIIEEPEDNEEPEKEEKPIENESPADNENDAPSEEEKEEPSEQQEEPVEQDAETAEVPIPSAIDALVNKKNNLPSTYVPEDLVKLEDIPTVLENTEINQLREPAYLGLKDLFEAAKEEAGYDLYARSGYRSYNTQDSLYKSYVSNFGQAAANKYSAKPGQSEHQTGLAMDITCAALNFQLDDTFADTDEGKWVSENAHRFGFIVRYIKGKEDITGYFYEPWHIRFLGTELATKVYESGLTLEEYLQGN